MEFGVSDSERVDVLPWLPDASTRLLLLLPEVKLYHYNICLTVHAGSAREPQQAEDAGIIVVASIRSNIVFILIISNKYHWLP